VSAFPGRILRAPPPPARDRPVTADAARAAAG